MTTQQTTQQDRQLRRPIDGRMIGGVSAGLGNRLSINPWFFRIAFIVLTVFGGAGIALYAIGWLLIPEQGSDEPILGKWFGGLDTSNTAMMIGIALIALAGLILVTTFDLLSGQILLAAALLVIGVLLYRGDIGGPSDPSGPNDPDDGGGSMVDDELAEGGATAVLEAGPEDGEGGGDPPDEALAVSAPLPMPPEPEPRSILGRLTIAAALIALGGLALLEVAGVLEPGFVHYVALALGIVGGGLLIGTLFGRARWLIAVGLILIPVVFLASVVPTWSFIGETGEVIYTATTIEEVEAEYELAAGSLELDLRAIEVEFGVRRAVDVRIGAGEIRIDVPRGVPVLVEASVGIGVVKLFGNERAGIGVDSSAETGSPPMLVINVEAGVGSIVVREG